MMENINYQFMLSLLIIALGYVMKRLNIITQKDGEALSKLIFNITLPALILHTFSEIQIVSSLIWLPIIAVIYGGLLCLFTIFIFRKEERSKRGLFSMALPGLNIGLFAFPLVEALWGQKGLKYIAMFDMGNSVIVLVVCYLIGSYFCAEKQSVDFKYIMKTLSKSLPLLAYVISIIINLLGIHLPKMVIDISKVLSRANMPLTLMLLGIYLSFSFDKSSWKLMIKALCSRYTIGIIVGMTLYFILPFEELFRNTVLLGTILPIPLLMIPYTVQFKYDDKLIGALINLTIIISFILTWIIFTLVSIT